MRRVGWETWCKRETKRNSADKRVQAIRCLSCHRLCQHPRKDDPLTWQCGCGGSFFVNTCPHPDEMEIAVKLYSRELEENNTYSKVAKEVLGDWQAEHPVQGDMPKRVRIYSQ